MRETAPEPAAPELAPELLAPAKQDPAPSSAASISPSAASAGDDPFEEDPYAAVSATYRPASNPTRFNLVAHGLFANVGAGDGSLNGRLGGFSVDAGQSWNIMGYALSLTVLGGEVTVADQAGAINVLVGGGPTLTLGRLAMVGRGMVDVRVGYDFMYAPVRRVDLDPEVAVPEVLAPHGPRLRLDLGLLGGANRRFWHGFGVTMGYQALVGSLRDHMPVSHVLSAGIVYWMG